MIKVTARGFYIRSQSYIVFLSREIWGKSWSNFKSVQEYQIRIAPWQVDNITPDDTGHVLVQQTVHGER